MKQTKTKAQRYSKFAVLFLSIAVAIGLAFAFVAPVSQNVSFVSSAVALKAAYQPEGNQTTTPSEPTEGATTINNYGEVRLNIMNDGSTKTGVLSKADQQNVSYTLVLTSYGYSNNGFTGKQPVSVWVVVSNNTFNKSAVDNANLSWNQIVTEISINNEVVNPNERLPLSVNDNGNDFVSNINKMAGAYEVKQNQKVYVGANVDQTQATETRYLVHTFNVQNTTIVRASFSTAQTYQINANFNSSVHNNGSYKFVAFPSETINSKTILKAEDATRFGILDSSKIANVLAQNNNVNASNIHFVGWYNNTTNPQLLSTSTNEFSISVPDQTNSTTPIIINAVFFQGKNLKIATQNVSGNNTVGGTAFVKITNKLAGAYSTTTKYFNPVYQTSSTDGFEEFVLLEGKANGNDNPIVFSAQEAEGFVFSGWYYLNETTQQFQLLTNSNGTAYAQTFSIASISNLGLTSTQINSLAARFTKTHPQQIILNGNGWATISHNNTTQQIGNNQSLNFEYGQTYTISATAANSISQNVFNSFSFNGTNLNQTNVKTILGDNAQLSDNTLTFTCTQNGTLQLNFGEVKTLYITANLLNQINGQDTNFFNISTYQTLIQNNVLKVLVNGIAQTITPENFQTIQVDGSAQMVLVLSGVPKNATVSVDLNTNGSTSGNLFNLRQITLLAFNNLGSTANQTTLASGTSAFQQDTATSASVQFNLSQNMLLSIELNAQCITYTTPITNGTITTPITKGTMYVHVFPFLAHSNGQTTISINQITISIIPNSGYAFKTAHFVSSANKVEFESLQTILQAQMSAINQGLSTTATMLHILKALVGNTTSSLETLNNALATITQNPIEAQIELVPVHTISASAVCVDTNETIQNAVSVSILNNNSWTNLNGLAPNNSTIRFEAVRTIQQNSKTYYFSHFVLDSAYLAGLEDPTNLSSLTSNSAIYTATNLSRSMSIVAVYRESQTITISTTINDNQSQFNNDLTMQIFSEQAQSVAGTYQQTVGTNTLLTFQSTNPNFAAFKVTQNGQTTIHTTHQISLRVNNATTVEQIINTPIDYTQNGQLRQKLLDYDNGNYTLSPNTNAGFVEVSNTTPTHGQTITLWATTNTDYVFVGFFAASPEAEKYFSTYTAISTSSTATTTANANKLTVAVFARAISISAISNTDQVVLLSDGRIFNNQQKFENQIFTYAGARVTLEVQNPTNFIGFYLAGDLVSPKGNTTTHTFVAEGNQNYVALYGNRNLNIYSTNGQTITNQNPNPFGSISATMGDGRTFSNVANLATTFAYSQTSTISLTAIANSGYTFAGWFTTDGTNLLECYSTKTNITISKHNNINLVAKFVQITDITFSAITSSGQNISSSIVSGVPSTAEIGQTLTITAAALNGYQFSRFTIINNGESSTHTSSSITITVNGPVSIVAQYIPLLQLTFTDSLSAGTTTINGQTTSTLFVLGQTTNTFTLTLNNTTHTLLHFVVNGKQTQPTSITTNGDFTTYTLEVATTQNTNVVAITNQIAQITVEPAQTVGSTQVGGSVSLASQAGIVGKEYTISATANSGFVFVGYTINGIFQPAEHNSNFTFTLSNNITITPHFAAARTITIEVSGGQITLNGKAYSNGQTATFAHGTTIAVGFAPASGNVLVPFSVTGLQTQNGTLQTSFTLTENKTIGAQFTTGVWVSVVSNANNQSALTLSQTTQFGTTTGQKLFVATGSQVTITVPHKYVLGQQQHILVGLFNQNIPMGNFSENNGTNVQFVATIKNTTQILANYQLAQSMVIRSAIPNNNTYQLITDPETLKTLITTSVVWTNGQIISAPWLINFAQTQTSNKLGAALEILAPTTVGLSIGRVLTQQEQSQFSGWFFVASSATNLFSQTNHIGTNSNILVTNNELSLFTQNVYLLAGFNTNITHTTNVFNGSISSSHNGTLSVSGNTITASANTGYVLAAYEVQIGARASKLFLRIPATTALTYTETNGITTLTDQNGTVVYCGRILSIRGVFQTPSTINPTEPKETFSLTAISGDPNVSIGLSTSGSTQVLSLVGQTFEIDPTTSLAYYQKAEGTRIYFLGWKNSNSSSIISTSTTLNITNQTNNINLEAVFETRHLVTIISQFGTRTQTQQTYITEGQTQTISATSTYNNRQATLLEGISINGQTLPLSTIGKTPSLVVPATTTQITNEFSISVLSPTTITLTYRTARCIQIIPHANGTSIVNNTQITENSFVVFNSNGTFSLSTTPNAGYIFGAYYQSTNNNPSLTSLQQNTIFSDSNLGASSTSIVVEIKSPATLTLTSNITEAQPTYSGNLGIGQTIRISAPQVSGYQFVGWQHNGQLVSTSADFSITLQATNTYHTLYINIYNITLTTIGAASSTATVSATTATKGQIITLSFDQNTFGTTNQFVGWRINGKMVSNATTFQISVATNLTIEAVFTTTNTITLPNNAVVVVSNGTVLSGNTASDTIQNQTSFVVGQNTTYKVLLFPTTSCYILDTNSLNSQTNIPSTTTLTNQTSNITQTQIPQNVRNITTITNIADVTIVGSGAYQLGKQATLSFALPDGTASDLLGNQNRALIFKHWTDSTGTILSTNPTYTFTVTDQNNLPITAVFDEYFLVSTNITTIGTGSGTITQNSQEAPASTYLLSGTALTITATADQNSLLTTATANNVQLPLSNNNTTYQTTLSSALHFAFTFAQKAIITFNIPSNWGAIDGLAFAVQILDPQTGATTQQIAQNTNNFSIVVPVGSTLIISATSTDRMQFVNWQDSAGNVLTQNTTLTLTDISSSQTLVSLFVPKYIITTTTETPNGETLQSNADLTIDRQNNFTLSANLTTNQQFVGFAYRTQNGNTTIITGSNITELLGANATLSGTTISGTATQNITIVVIANQTKTTTILFQTPNGATIADAQIKAELSNTASSFTAPTTIDFAGSTYTFVEWQNAVGNQITTQNPLTYTADGSTYIAIYSKIITINPQITEATHTQSGYTYAANNLVGMVTGGGNITEGKRTTLTAIASTGHIFVGWFNQNQELVSDKAIYNYQASSTKQIAHAVFIKVFNIKLITQVGGQVSGAVESTFSGTYTFNEGGTKHIYAQNGSTLTLNFAAKNGYKFIGLYSGDQLVTSQSTYTTTVSAAQTLTARFINFSTLSVSITQNLKTTPTTNSSVEINGQTQTYPNSFKIDFEGSQTFTLTFSLPTGSQNYTLTKVLVNGSPVSATQNANGTYTITLSNLATSTTVQIYVGEYVRVDLSSEFEGTQNFFDFVSNNFISNGQNTVQSDSKGHYIMALFGSQIKIAPSANGYPFSLNGQNKTIIFSYATSHHTNGSSTNHTTSPAAVDVSATLSSITIHFKEISHNITIYFPIDIRTATYAPSLIIFENSQAVCIINQNGVSGAISTTSFGVQIQGNNVVLTDLKHGYNTNLSIAFAYYVSTNGTYLNSPRADIILGTQTLNIGGNGAYGNSALPIDLTEALTTNNERYFIIQNSDTLLSSLTITPFFTPYSFVEASHNGLVGTNEDKITLTTQTTSLTTQNTTNGIFNATVARTWAKTGSQITITATNNNQGTQMSETDGSYDAGLDSIAISSTFFYSTTTNSAFQTWRNSPNSAQRPGYSVWQDIKEQDAFEKLRGTKVGSTGLTVSISLASDLCVLADYMDFYVQDDPTRIIYTVLQTGISDGDLNYPAGSTTQLTTSNGQKFNYTIISPLEASNLGYVQNNTTVKDNLIYAQNGSFINGDILIHKIEKTGNVITSITYYSRQTNDSFEQKTAQANNQTTLTLTSANTEVVVLTTSTSTQNQQTITCIVKGSNGRAQNTSIWLLSSLDGITQPQNENQTGMKWSTTIPNKRDVQNSTTSATTTVATTTTTSTTDNISVSFTTSQITTNEGMNEGNRPLGVRNLTITVSAPSGQTFTDNGNNFLGFIVKSAATTGTSMAFVNTSYGTLKNADGTNLTAAYDFGSNTFIPKSKCNNNNDTAYSTTINFVGPVEVVALFEKHLVLVSVNKNAAFKTGTDGGVAISGTYRTEDGELQSHNATLKAEDVQRANDSHITAVIPVGNSAAPDYYIVHTNLIANNGQIKTSYLFDYQSKAELYATVYTYGEFAGYQFQTAGINNISLTSTYTTQTDSETTTQTVTTTQTASGTYSLGQNGIFAPNRTSQNIAYADQTLHFDVNQLQITLNTYFTAVRYKATINFAQLANNNTTTSTSGTNSTKTNAEVLFNKTKQNQYEYGVGTLRNEYTYSISDLSKYLDPTTYTIDASGNVVPAKNKQITFATINKKPVLQIKNASDLTQDITYTISAKLCPATNKYSLSVTFFMDAVAGAGFENFHINLNTSHISGTSFVFFPQENTQKGTIEPNAENVLYNKQFSITGANSSSIDLSYNNAIGSGEIEVEPQEYSELVQNVNIIIATQMSSKTATIGSTKKGNYLTDPTTIVIKNGNQFLSQNENFFSDLNTKINDLTTLPVSTLLDYLLSDEQSQKYTNMNGSNKVENWAIWYFANSLKGTTLSTNFVHNLNIYSQLINLHQNNEGLKHNNFYNIDNSKTTYTTLFDPTFVGELFKEYHKFIYAAPAQTDDPNTSIPLQYKIMLENGRYLYLTKADGNWNIDNTKNTADSLTYQNTSIKVEKGKVSITRTENGNSVTLVDNQDLIISFYKTFTSTLQNNSTQTRTVEIEIYNTYNNGNQTITCSQDDMVLSEITNSNLYQEQINGEYVLGLPKTAERAYEYFNNVQFGFTNNGTYLETNFAYYSKTKFDQSKLDKILSENAFLSNMNLWQTIYSSNLSATSLVSFDNAGNVTGGLATHNEAVGEQHAGRFSYKQRALLSFSQNAMDSKYTFQLNATDTNEKIIYQYFKLDPTCWKEFWPALVTQIAFGIVAIVATVVTGGMGGLVIGMIYATAGLLYGQMVDEIINNSKTLDLNSIEAYQEFVFIKTTLYGILLNPSEAFLQN